MTGNTVLLLIDCQEDFLARPGLHPARDALVAAIAARLERARADGQSVIHVRTIVAADGSNAMPHRRRQPEVIEGTAGAEPPAALAPRDGEPVFEKRFFSAFDAPGLERCLTELGANDLELAGVHTHACLQATALDAYARGFKVAIDPATIGSDRPVHAAVTLEWLNGRAATIIGIRDADRFEHRNPCDQREVLFDVHSSAADALNQAAERVSAAQSHLAAMPIAERAERLRHWQHVLAERRDEFISAIVRDLGKPVVDALGEVDYGLSLLDHVATTLDDCDPGLPEVRYRPAGLAGLITPWNNPFAIPLGKIAPALGFGNAVLWKPAVAGSGIARLIVTTLEAAGLAEHVALVTGNAATGRALAACPMLCRLSFTGSVPIGRALIAAAGHRALPVQCELGGSNAAIVHASADLDLAASDLAAAMFSFAGQRCTAIRRVIVDTAVAGRFADKLGRAVEGLRVGGPADPATQVGPVIDRAAQERFRRLVAEAADAGATVVAGTSGGTDHGCWLAPAILANLPSTHELWTHEVFGPVAAVCSADEFDQALGIHNASDFGLVGALFAADEAVIARFNDEAQAGMLSINRARPPFAASGPFTGWKASSFGPAEHGRWNREFYAQPQALYR